MRRDTDGMPLVTADWLAANIDHVVVVDCRWTLGEPGAGRRAYNRAHLPRARHLDVDADLSAPPSADPGAAGGRHPLPQPDAFARRAATAGIDATTPVVAYDEGHGGAARLWWLLRHFGHPAPHVLAGGFDSWHGPLATGEEPAPPQPVQPFVAHPRSDDIATAAEIQDRLGEPGFDLIDARAPERFRGEREPIDPVAGHIPGARNVPFTAPLGEIAAQLGPAEAVAYCGSGVSAATLVLAGEADGKRVRLYPGSWSEWCRRGLPVERGDPS